MKFRVGIIIILANFLVSCHASGQNEEWSSYRVFLETSYIISSVKDARSIIDSDIKRLLASGASLSVDEDVLKRIGVELVELEDRFTNIATAKLHFEPDSTVSNDCDFFKFAVQVGVVADAVHDVSRCISGSCSLDEKTDLNEDLSVKLAPLDKHTDSCLSSIPQ